MTVNCIRLCSTDVSTTDIIIASDEWMIPFATFCSLNRLELFSLVVILAWATSKLCCVTPIYIQSTTCRKPWHHVMSSVTSALGSTSTAPLRRRAKKKKTDIMFQCLNIKINVWHQLNYSSQPHICNRPITLIFHWNQGPERTLCLSTWTALRCGSNSRRRGSMLIGDWRRPLLHRFHSGFTRPQKSGPFITNNKIHTRFHYLH